MDLVVEDSPVDFELFKFIYQTFISIKKANFTAIQFLVASILKEYDDKLIEEFHELEEDLAAQNELLDKLVSKQESYIEASSNPNNTVPTLSLKELRKISRESGDLDDFKNRVYKALRGEVDE